MWHNIFNNIIPTLEIICYLQVLLRQTLMYMLQALAKAGKKTGNNLWSWKSSETFYQNGQRLQQIKL